MSRPLFEEFEYALAKEMSEYRRNLCVVRHGVGYNNKGIDNDVREQLDREVAEDFASVIRRMVEGG